MKNLTTEDTENTEVKPKMQSIAAIEAEKYLIWICDLANTKKSWTIRNIAREAIQKIRECSQ